MWQHQFSGTEKVTQQTSFSFAAHFALILFVKRKLELSPSININKIYIQHTEDVACGAHKKYQPIKSFFPYVPLLSKYIKGQHVTLVI